MSNQFYQEYNPSVWNRFIQKSTSMIDKENCKPDVLRMEYKIDGRKL